MDHRGGQASAFDGRMKAVVLNLTSRKWNESKRAFPNREFAVGRIDLVAGLKRIREDVPRARFVSPRFKFPRMAISPQELHSGSVPRADSILRLATVGIFGLVCIALINTWAGLKEVEKSDHWFRNADMNIHNMVDALSINAEVPPNMIDQPGVPLKYGIALYFRVEHALGNLPVWSMEEFSASAEPLYEIPPLIRAQRSFSRIVVVGFIIAGGILGYQLSGSLLVGGLTALLFCGSSGLLFHGFITRPELMCVGWGGVIALFCTDRGLQSGARWTSPLWLLFGGLSIGLSYLSKLPGICFLGLAVGWIALRSWGAKADPDDSNSEGKCWAGSLILIGVAGALFWLAAHLRVNFESLGQVPMVRLKQASAVLVFLGLVTWWQPVPAKGRAVMARVREMAVLMAGLMAVFPACFVLFRLVMNDASASDYLARTISLVLNPIPFLHTVATNENWVGTFWQFSRENRGLFWTALMVGGATLVGTKVPLRERWQIVLLLLIGFGLTLIMSKRHYLHQYNLFSQSMLLLAMGLSFHAWYRSYFTGASRRSLRALLLIVGVSSFLFALGGTSRAFDWYQRYQDDALPDNPLTVLFFFSHDAHTRGYLDAMRSRYGDRDQFAQELQDYLADPNNRY